VRENTATRAIAGGVAAIERRDFDAMAPMFCEAFEEVHHPTGSTYGREQALASVQRLLRSSDATYRVESLAVLGDHLMLGRRRIHASATGGGRFDVGEYENDTLALMEVDQHGLYRSHEVFAPDKLGDAIVRLYERYAELLPEGPERSRIAATSRAIATQLGPLGYERFVSAVDAAVKYIDHRRLVGAGSFDGAQEFRDAFRALFESAGQMTNRVDDILALRTDALVVRVLNLGTERAGGGTYERPFLVVSVLGGDGLITQVEAFDADREAEALARFDELAVPPPKPRALRRVRPNATRAFFDACLAALESRDAGALDRLHAESMEAVLHPLGTTLTRGETLDWWRLFLGDGGEAFHSETIATLGGSLALARQSWSGAASNDATFAVGAFQRDSFALIEVDARGRAERIEVFAADKLGDALVRLYERRAELLPAGPERDRAATIARSAAALQGPLDLDRLAGVMAPDVQFVDHRIVGVGCVQ
jgi:hypothetical protein